ncbi:MAG: hypothetical protein AB1757_29310 [Acidobacteriota bacterium]
MPVQKQVEHLEIPENRINIELISPQMSDFTHRLGNFTQALTRVEEGEALNRSKASAITADVR